MRLDVYLAERGITKSRSSAAECIKSGLVSVNGNTDVKPSLDISAEDQVVLLGRPHEFVGRGGVKLDFALSSFGIDVAGYRCVDIGASTGGFTDCLLKRGAMTVLAVDSGHGQLDPSLRSDSRVISLEGFNARELTADNVPFVPNIAVCDVSFISQTLILPAVCRILPTDGIYIGLVKPQFECGRAALGKGGVVRDKKSHAEAVQRVSFAAADMGFSVIDIIPSPVNGGDGNREFLLYAKKGGVGPSSDELKRLTERICK